MRGDLGPDQVSRGDSFVKTLCDDDFADLMEQTLGEEYKADDKLTEVTVANINEEAFQVGR